MKTLMIYKCVRCGKEYTSNPYKFDFGRMKWHTVNYSQYSEKKFANKESKPEDLCHECYKELKHWLSGISDEAKHLKERINELEKENEILHERNQEVSKSLQNMEKEKKEIEESLKSCKMLCPYGEWIR